MDSKVTSPSVAVTPQSRSQQQPHSRTYQACIPCRHRKVRCDLGPVDNPNDPPCVRCRRESKDCFFSATRRKRKFENLDDENSLENYELHNEGKRLCPTSSAVLPQTLTPGRSVRRFQPLRRSGGSQIQNSNEEDQNVNSKTTAILQTAEVYSGHDALNLLFEAAERSSGEVENIRPKSSCAIHRPRTGSRTATGSQPNMDNNDYRVGEPRAERGPMIEPSNNPFIGDIYANQLPVDNASFEQAKRVWSRFRFVRAGWFTVSEAIAYIDYFYQFLAPLTPIILPDYRHPFRHEKLLKEEPVLVLTLLTISARFMRLSGPGRSSRTHAIHEKLWSYLQSMIDRMIWGQEQRGSGVCGAGAKPPCDVNPLSRKGLRTLGTVESLMLLTEWHPRAIHFPPGDDGDELMAPSDADLTSLYDGCSTPEQSQDPKVLTRNRNDSWLEQCWRSDRLCWMLLGNAMALAFEIGVFDDASQSEFHEENKNLPEDLVVSFFGRKRQLKDLLLTYLAQTSGRLGLTSLLPKTRNEPFFLKDLEQRLNERVGSQLRSLNDQKERSRVSINTKNYGDTLHFQETVLYYWMKIAAINELGNQQMFANRRHTRDLIKSGKYVDLLQMFQPMLRAWWIDFEQSTAIPIHMRHILTIEYEYSRVYLNSLALQAVVERCTHNSPSQSSDGDTISFSTLTKWYGGDRYYIKEVIDASRSALRVVIDGLNPEGFLRHAPVRTYFRIISVAIILLKTFALGATEDDVAISLGLMDRTVEVLRSSVVDDVHVSNHFADHLETLTRRIRSRFVRMAANNTVTQSSQPDTRSPSIQSFGRRQQTPTMISPSNSLRSSQMLPVPPTSAVQPGTNYFDHLASAPTKPSHKNGTASTSTCRITPDHPLWGVSTQRYDHDTKNISIMPPPQFEAYGQIPVGNGNGVGVVASSATSSSAVNPAVRSDEVAGLVGSTNDDLVVASDWLALPLDPLLQSRGADVTQTTYGPDVGGYDLLDLLLTERKT